MTTITNDQRSTVTGTGGLFQCGLGLDLVVTSNAITITDSVHFVGGTGILTTINFGTVSAPSTPTIVYLISSAGSTWTFGTGAGGNITGPYPVTTHGTVFVCLWDGTSFRILYTDTTIDPIMFGAVGDGVHDDTVAVQTALTVATLATTITFKPTRNGYLVTAPLVVNQNFTALTSPGYMQAYISSDLTNYTGPYPKWGIILGDSLSTPSADSTVQGNSISNIRLNVTNGVGGIFATRSTLSRIDNVNVVGTGLTYGIRILASDSQFDVRNCSIANTGSESLIPTIGISVENGSNQVHLEDNSIRGSATGIQLFNSMGTWINRNTIQTRPAVNQTVYGIKIVTNQAVPSWLSWVPAAGDYHIKDNWFESSDAAGATIYGVYVGSGTPSAHAVIGTVLEDNYFFGTTAATNYPIYIDYGEQTIVRGARWYGTIQDLVHITAHSDLAIIDMPTLSTFNQTAIGGQLINDSGTRTQMLGRYSSPAYSAGTYTAVGGGNTWTVQAEDVDDFRYSYYATRMHLIVYLINTDVGGAPTVLQIALPGRLTIAKDARVIASVVDAGVVAANSTITAVGGTSVLWVNRGDGAAFTASTGQTSVQFEIELEVA